MKKRLQIIDSVSSIELQTFRLKQSVRNVSCRKAARKRGDFLKGHGAVTETPEPDKIERRGCKTPKEGNKHRRENLPFIIAGRGGGSINTRRFLPDAKGNQGDLLMTLLSCAGVPVDRPIGIATKQITDIKA